MIRWVEVYRECYGVAMHEELPYLAEYLTDNEVADARSPRYSKGYPECDVCACIARSDTTASRWWTICDARPLGRMPFRTRMTDRRAGWAGGERSPRRRPGELRPRTSPLIEIGLT